MPNVLGVYRVTLSFLVSYARKPSRHLTIEHTMQRSITKTKLRGLSPRANYTDRAAAAGRRS
jgi:hypothetical protein